MDAWEREACESRRWRGWSFWLVTMRGGYNPAEVARDWTLLEVIDCGFDLQLRASLDSF